MFKCQRPIFVMQPFPVLRLFSGLILLVSSLSSCAVFQLASTRKSLKIKQEVVHSPVFSKSFTGFTLLDPVTGKMLVDVQGDHYFIPASSTKILTLATCLEVLGDSVPGIQMALVIENQDSTRRFLPTCDPTFLHPRFQAWQPVNKLFNKIKGGNYLYMNAFKDNRYGPGWAWDDYGETFAVERSGMPIFGNQMSIIKKDSNWIIEPVFYEAISEVTRKGTLMNLSPKAPMREEGSNLIYIPLDEQLPEGYQQSFPILSPDVRFFQFTDTIGNIHPDAYFWTEEEARSTEEMIQTLEWKTIFSAPIDTVFRLMMYHSDNFVAEQMLLVSAGAKFNYLKQDTIIHWMLDSVLNSLPQRPRWVDGSGLSRYNLITPQTITAVLQRLWKTQPRERLFSLFPAGGHDGTIAEWYPGPKGKPYVFAKTGSMSGVNCLSGYLLCHSGKVLIFSFMHNHYIGSNKPWKVEMQRILEKIARQY